MGTKVLLEAKATVTVADYNVNYFDAQSFAQAVDLGGYCELTAFVNVLSSDLGGTSELVLQTATEPFEGSFANTEAVVAIDDDGLFVASLNKFARYVRWAVRQSGASNAQTATFGVTLYAKRRG